MTKNDLFEKTSNIELAIVIPTLNEEFSIKKVIDHTISSLKEFPKSYKIIITDNNSSDRTLEIASNYKNVLINSEKKIGYGSNLHSAFSKINSKFIIFFDCDGSYSPEYIVKFYKNIIASNNDMVIGNRLNSSENNSMPILHRFLGTPILSFLIRFLFNIKIFDCNCGMRIFKTSSYKNISIYSGGMEFASEMLIKFSKHGYSISEMDIYFKKDIRNRKPHLSTWRDGWRHLRFIISSIKSNQFKFLTFFVGIIYLSIFFLSFFKTTSGLPKFHTIFSLLSILFFFQSTYMGIINMRLGMYLNNNLQCDLTKKLIHAYEKNFYMKIFIFFLSIFFIELMFLLFIWFDRSFGEMLYLENMIRILLYSSIGSFFINLDLIFESWSKFDPKETY